MFLWFFKNYKIENDFKNFRFTTHYSRSRHHRVAKNHGFDFRSSRGQNIFSATHLFLWHFWVKNFSYATALFPTFRKSSGRLLWTFILFLQLFLSIPQSLSSTSLPSQNRTPDLSFAFAKFLHDLIFGLNKITLFQSLSWRYSIFWSSHGQKNI